MNAGRILEGAGHDLGHIRSQLGTDPVSVNVWLASRRFRSLWRSGVRALTLGRNVFVDPRLLVDRERLARVVVHELVHVRQFEEDGFLPFLWRYVRAYISQRWRGLGPREAYLAIPAEQEAREITSRVM
ncbi:MAG: DUF4157 domain-containing protein [Acidimicrobiia bacterium]|nr:DUF4157 domain-containing protein [Acidimicrobiia bacterium]